VKVLISAVSAKMGGAATYFRNLANELAKLDSLDEFIFCVPEKQARSLDGLPPNVRVITSIADGGPFWKRLWYDQITLRGIIKREHVTVLHSTGNFGMFACPCVQFLLVRNSIYFSNFYLTRILPRKGWRFRIDLKLRRWLICHSVKWANLVITPSQSMLDEMRRFIKGPSSKFRVNPYGTIVEHFRLNPDSHAEELSDSPNRIMRLLHVSHYSDHKNVGVLFRALGILHERGVSNVTLSTTADVRDVRYDPKSLYRAADLELLQQPIIGERVKVLGDVTYDKLPSLYHNHDIFIFPSLTESYGHPLVEAMASGLPTIAADTPVSRELCGEAAIYFDPLSAEDLASKIEHLIGDPGLREMLRESGRLRVESMTWRSHVVRLLELYRHVAPYEKSEAVKTAFNSSESLG
jgi:glycosyltransferase involved in cell wall biosynthesis